MIKLTALRNTALKKRPIQSYLSEDHEVHLVRQGKTYHAYSVETGVSGHWYVELAYNAGHWYIYRPHWRIKDNNIDEVSSKGLDLIKKYEGLRLNAYRCPAGVWTIGYGHTATAEPGMRITQQEAERLLKEYDVGKYESAVNEYVTVSLSQNQFDALVSFAFNVGVYAFRTSTLLKRVNREDWRGAADEFERWVYGGGRRLAGLVRRRREERQLFLTPDR